tara:strand:+ start:198 stop:560 length:363 start_codon:yes stop_codon:yes gene_type:complete
VLVVEELEELVTLLDNLVEIVPLDLLSLLLAVEVEVNRINQDNLVDLVVDLELMVTDITNLEEQELLDKDILVVEVHLHRTELLEEVVEHHRQEKMDIHDQTPDLQMEEMELQIQLAVLR